MAQEPNSVTKSGIATDASTGERYVPSSVRADGSRRREIRVRPGYKPPEDVELYRNRAAAAWKNRGQGGVPGADSIKTENIPPTTVSAASNKNAKRREAKKKAKSTEDEPAMGGGRNVAEIANWRSFAASGGDEKKETDEGSRKTTTREEKLKSTTEEPALDPETENEKKARNMKKKLRQARDLNDKKDQGEALLPEQLDKIIKINELVRQLDALGLDSNGDKKDGSEEEKKDKGKESA